jgi:hypothetical protein
MFLPRILISPSVRDVAVAFVDAIEAPQQRRLPAAARADEGGDLAVPDITVTPWSAWKLPYQSFTSRQGDGVRIEAHPKIPLT